LPQNFKDKNRSFIIVECPQCRANFVIEFAAEQPFVRRLISFIL
jgi:hypothetical protein